MHRTDGQKVLRLPIAEQLRGPGKHSSIRALGSLDCALELWGSSSLGGQWFGVILAQASSITHGDCQRTHQCRNDNDVNAGAGTSYSIARTAAYISAVGMGLFSGIRPCYVCRTYLLA